MSEDMKDQAEQIMQDDDATPSILDKVDQMGDGSTEEQVAQLKQAGDELIGN